MDPTFVQKGLNDRIVRNVSIQSLRFAPMPMYIIEHAAELNSNTEFRLGPYGGTTDCKFNSVKHITNGDSEHHSLEFVEFTV